MLCVVGALVWVEVQDTNIAQVISEFPLVHDEVVTRRKLLSQAQAADEAQVCFFDM
jgi:hypothetical protein